MGEWLINDFIPDPNTGKDRWQIYKIFKGGMGIVYIVYDAEWREAFAVKTYQDKLQSERAQELFKKEALIWINLDRHDNIAWARMVQNIHNRLYLFLEYVPGDDLSRWVGTKRLDLKQTLLFAIQFCYGMEHALAKGVKAHRDIKPQNCLITQDRTLKITDFGLAKVLDIAEAEQVLDQTSDKGITNTRTGQIGGTLPYMAPEQFEDLKHVDVKADIYSFGIMLYELICGKLPFKYDNNSNYQKKYENKKISDLPKTILEIAPTLNDIIEKCVSKLPEDRYLSFAALKEDLSNLYIEIFSSFPPKPKNIESLYLIDIHNKAAALDTLGKYDESLNYYNQAINLDQKNAKIWSNMGTVLTHLEKFEEALKCYDRAINIEPNYASAWYNKGNTLKIMGRLIESMNCFDYSLEIHPEKASAWNNKSAILHDLKRYHEALDCSERAVELDIYDPIAWYNKGNALFHLKRYQEAINCFDITLKLNPNDNLVLGNKAAALIKIGELDKALVCCDHVLHNNPNDVTALTNKGIILAASGNKQHALIIFKKAKELGSPTADYCIKMCLNKLYSNRS